MIDFHKQLSIIPEVYETATLQDNLEHSGGISLSWKSKHDDEIALGSYVTYGGIRYLLMEPYAPSKESPIYYKYSPTFKHPQALFGFIPFWIKSLDAEGNPIDLRTTSYTGFPYIIAQKVVDQMAEYANKMHDSFFAESVGLTWNATDEVWESSWMVNIDHSVDSSGRIIDAHTIITVGFDGCSIKGAADAIADAMGCNVFFDWSFTEYTFTDDEGHEYTKMCRTIRFVAGSTIQGEAFNCYHVLGGTTNMGKNTASGSFAAVTQRLTLDETQYPGSIISHAQLGGVMLTKELIFDDIYPKMELYICYAHQRLCYLTDNDTGEFIVDHWRYYYMSGDTKVYAEFDHESEGKKYDADGHELTAEAVYKTFAKWYVRLSTDCPVWDEEHKVWNFEHPYKFDQSKLIDDKPLTLLFQMDYREPEHMSKLVGREFELTYFPDKEVEWGKTDVVDYDNAYATYTNGEDPDSDPNKISEFRIASVAEGITILPSTDDIEMCPMIGDKVTLVNMALTDEKARAQQELKDAALEIIALMETPAGEYTETVILGREINGRRIDSVTIGQETPFEADVPVAERKHGPIVTQINHNLDTDVAEVTVGSWTRKTRTGGTADKVETVTVSANSSTEGGTPYSDGSIGLGGGYGGNSVETYEQTSLKPESMFVAGLSNTIDAVACDTDGKVRIASDIYTKITALAGVKDVTAACTVAIPALPPVDDSDINNPKRIRLYIEASSSGTSGTEITQTKEHNSYDLSESNRWLRISIPLGYDMSLIQDTFLQTFLVEHPAYTERQLDFVVNAMRQGINGIGGAFKSRAFTRTNTDISGITPTGGNYNSPLPTNSTVGTETIVWSDGIPQGTAKLWSTVRTFYQDSTVSSWSNPAQETDTATLDIEFSPSATKPSAPSGNTPFADHSLEGWYDPSNLPSETMIWRAERKVSNGVFVGDWVITRIYGEKGNNGGNTATVMLYRRHVEDRQSWGMPTIKLWYDFEAKKLYTSESGTTEPTSEQLGGWSLTIPNDSTEPIYVTAAIAYSASGRDDIETSEWVTPAQYTENGSDGQPGQPGQPGAHGINSAAVFLYQRYSPTTQAPLPAKPIKTLYYKFADGQLYTKNGNVYTLAALDDRNNWELTIPATNGNPCFVIQAAALNAEDYDAIEVTQSKDDWSSIRKMVEDGKDGNSVTYDEQGSSMGYAYSSMGSPETGRDYPSDIISWSSTIPAVQKGNYLWRRDITAYKNSDGSSAGSTTTYGVEYQPYDGESVEIDTNRTFIGYCKQTSSEYTGQHPDDNQFSTTYPSDLAKGDYLWILNQLAYVGVVNPLKSYSVSMLGTDGTNGDPGADGYTTHFAYATSADGSQNFSTTSFAGATYIGTYRDQNGPDSLDYRDYTWTQWKGDKGDNGRGITNTNIYYKAASSTPAKPSGNPTGTGWSDDGNSLITDTNADKHLYESTCTTYSDGTYSWTTPVDDGLISDMAATSEEFALSDSSTTAPTSGWSTSVTPTAGKWIWSRTVLTFRNGNKKYVNTQCVGYTGIDGTSVIAQYAPNNNPTEQQIHNTFQSGDKYMRTSSDGGVNWSGWQKIVGEDGKDGKDGKDGVDGENGDYTVFSFNISDLLTGVNGSTAYPDHLGYATWQDAPPATTSTMKYLWCEEVRHTFVNGVDTPGIASYFRITGENAIRVDLDNQHEDFIYDDAGNRKSAVVTSQAHLYDGPTEVTTNIAWQVCCNVGATTETWTDAKDTFTKGSVANAKISTGGLLTVDQIYVDTAKVKVRAKYPNDSTGKYYHAEFTGNRTNQDKYDLLLNPNSISYNSATYPQAGRSISLGATRTDLQGVTTDLPFGAYDDKSKISSTSGKGYLRLFIYQKVAVAQGVYAYVPTQHTTSSFTVKSAYCNDNENLRIMLRKYDNCEVSDGQGIAGKQVDYEAIPITKAQNGAQGPQGDPGDPGDPGNAYTLRTSPSQLVYNPNISGWVGASRFTVTRLNNGATVSTGTLEVTAVPTNGSSVIVSALTGTTYPDVNIYQDYVRFDIAWKDSNNNVIATASVPIVKFGQNGSAGSAGHVGRWYYYAGVYDATKDYTLNNTQAPYVQYGTYDNDRPKFWMFDNKGVEPQGGTRTIRGNTPTASSDAWTEMAAEQEYYIAKAFFGNYANFGSFIINGDWMISQNGGPSGKTYTNFNPDEFSDWVNGDASSYSGFIPNYAVDGRTGTTYQKNAHVEGEIIASRGTIGGFKITDTTIQHNAQDPNIILNSDGTIQAGAIVFTKTAFTDGHTWQGLAFQDDSGRDALAWGVTNYNGSYGGHIALRAQGSTSYGGVFDLKVAGNATQSRLVMGQGIPQGDERYQIDIDGIEPKITVQNKSTSGPRTYITPTGISLPKVYIAGNDGYINARYINTWVTIQSGSSYTVESDYEKVILTNNGDQTLRLPDTTQNGRIVYVRKINSGWCEVKAFNGTSVIRRFDKDDYWQIFVYVNGSWY